MEVEEDGIICKRLPGFIHGDLEDSQWAKMG